MTDGPTGEMGCACPGAQGPIGPIGTTGRVQYHVVYDRERKRKFSRWVVKEAITGHVLGTFFFKFFAVRFAIVTAKEHVLSSLMIHKKDGSFQEERTYGNDPYPPKG